ncbi:MAG: hypothetical protein IJ274_04880 [Lachnospiraceae bacterium]|nr:hypothetical protein [Lachnospiraceae bacterium]
MFRIRAMEQWLNCWFLDSTSGWKDGEKLNIALFFLPVSYHVKKVAVL